MTGLDERLARTVRRMNCPVHHQKAYFAMTNRRISLDCCCNAFKIICLGELVKVLTEEKEKKGPDGQL